MAAVAKTKKTSPSNTGGTEMSGINHPSNSFTAFLNKYALWITLLGGTGLLTTLGILFTPLTDLVFHKIYKENIEIKHIIDNKRIFEGEDLFYQLLIMPASSADISRGVMTLVYDDSIFTMHEGQIVYDIPASKNPILIPSESKIRLKPRSDGRFFIKATLETQYGIYQDSVSVEVLPSANMVRPTQNNFSGLWEFKLGYEDGQMELLDRKGKISGSYILKSGDNGTIAGVRDGNVFMVDFIRKGELFKWHIDANWKIDKDFLEIKGNSRLLKIGNKMWLEVDNNTKVFYSNVYLL